MATTQRIGVLSVLGILNVGCGRLLGVSVIRRSARMRVMIALLGVWLGYV